MNFQTVAAVGFHAGKPGVFAEKSGGKQGQNFAFSKFSGKTDVQFSVVELSVGTEFYAAALIFRIHACNEEKTGKVQDFVSVQTHGNRTDGIESEVSER